MKRAIAAEAVGSFMLFATVVGSGIMAENLAGGNVALALVGNTAATGAMLYVLITMLGPISGAHFNPAVTLVFRLLRVLDTRQSLGMSRRSSRAGSSESGRRTSCSGSI